MATAGFPELAALRGAKIGNDQPCLLTYVS